MRSKLTDVAETMQHRLQIQGHVFAVWDFMSIAKRLQRDLTCISLPWTPSEDASLARFINEIIHSEESDAGPHGVPASHLEIYLSAMRELGANTTPFLSFLNALKAGLTPADAMRAQGVPKHVFDFVSRTLDVAMNGHSVEVVADFLYGREDIIPEMFELDGGNHSPAARRMLERIAGDDEDLWDKAAQAARSGIESRIALWDGCQKKLARIPQSRTPAGTLM